MFYEMAEIICTAAHVHDGAIISPDALIRFAFENGYYSYIDTIDDDGNLLDSEKTISRENWQELADIFAPGLDIINL